MHPFEEFDAQVSEVSSVLAIVLTGLGNSFGDDVVFQAFIDLMITKGQGAHDPESYDTLTAFYRETLEEAIMHGHYDPITA
jgi:hypothetical protein